MKKLLIILIIIGACFIFIHQYFFEKKLFDYTMINVNVDVQGDAHLIEIPNGPTVLIDAGYQSEAKKSLIPLLKRKKISVIDYFFYFSCPQRPLRGRF